MKKDFQEESLPLVLDLRKPMFKEACHDQTSPKYDITFETRSRSSEFSFSFETWISKCRNLNQAQTLFEIIERPRVRARRSTV